MIDFALRDLGSLWTELEDRALQDARTNIAFPGATDLSFAGLARLQSTVLLNNIGSPYDGGHGRNHTKVYERAVVDLVADMFGAPASRWGYVTSGSTECIEHALLEARTRYSDAVIYASAAAHYKLAELAVKLMMPMVVIATDCGGAIDLADLEGELARRRDRAAVIVAVAGTTVTEAVDDVPGIAKVCQRLSIARRRIHVDAALSGIPLQLAPVRGVPRCDFTVRVVDSISISGHKFLSTLTPCGIVVYREPPLLAVTGPVSYTGTASVTLSASRSGHTSLLLYAALMQVGAEGHRRRARSCRATAVYAAQRLRAAGLDARRHAHAFTVYFPPLPDAQADKLAEKWVLSSGDEFGHIICMPQVTSEVIDEFAGDVAALRRGKHKRVKALSALRTGT